MQRTRQQDDPAVAAGPRSQIPGTVMPIFGSRIMQIWPWKPKNAAPKDRPGPKKTKNEPKNRQKVNVLAPARLRTTQLPKKG